jgi:hypothetical protein
METKVIKFINEVINYSLFYSTLCFVFFLLCGFKIEVVFDVMKLYMVLSVGFESILYKFSFGKYKNE